MPKAKKGQKNNRRNADRQIKEYSNTIKIKVDTSEVDIALRKVDELSTKIQEAKSLADEMASYLERIDLKLDV